MYKGHDRVLGMGAAIARRDFLNGVGVAITSSLLLPRDVEAFARLMQQEESTRPRARAFGEATLAPSRSVTPCATAPASKTRWTPESATTWSWWEPD